MTEKRAPTADSTAAEPDATDPTEAPSPPTSAEYTVAFSPRQAAVGFAIVAGLVAIAIRRHRGRKRGGED